MQRLVALVVALSSLVIELSHANLSCNEFQTETCFCFPESPNEYILQCEHIMSIKVKQDKFVQIDCLNQNQTDLPDLPNLHIGDTERFILRLCPLTDKSIRDLMTDIGINNVTIIQIQTLNIPNVTLEKKHLEKLHDVTKLIISHNNLTSLPEDVFEDMGNLTVIDMKNNNIELLKDVFRFTPKLEKIELGRNNLTYLEPGIFKNLKQLKFLNLWDNKLTNLKKGVFSDVPNLDSLDLHSNKMETISGDIFEDLIMLTVLSLHSNAFKNLPQGLLSKNKKLEKFLLHDNNRTLASLPHGFLSNLTKLKEVRLSNNKLMSLPENIFSGSSNIQELYLDRNSLKTLEVNTFHALEHLKILDLSKNQISFLPEELFSKTKNLVKLKLDHNSIMEILPHLFMQLSNLEYMDLSFNKIEEITGPQFDNLEKLKELNISKNQLTSLALSGIQINDFGNFSVLRNCKNLEDLQLSNNSLSEIYADWKTLFNRLRIINLSFNRFHTIESNDLNLLGDVFIDLSNNAITFVDFRDIGFLAKDSQINPRHINFENNSFNCDCKMLPFIQFVQGHLSSEEQSLFDIPANNLQCEEPEFLAKKLLKDVPVDSLTCQLPNCTANCTCHYRPLDKGQLITCQNKGLHEIPSSLPVNIHTTHIELHLEGNHLQSFKVDEKQGYENVTHLYLSNNNITSIDVSGLSNNLKVLDISHNKLSALTPDTISYLENNSTPELEQLALYDNLWQCNCEATSLIRMVKSRYKQVKPFLSIKCSNGTLFDVVQEGALCPVIVNYIIFIVCLSVAIFSFLVAFTTALYFKYEKAIRIYCFSSKWKILRWLVSHPESDEEKLYDAFISFSNVDFGFVSEHLVPQLEESGEERNFKLCLHYRDFQAGETIPNQILHSVKNSRRTIVVLSPAFLKSMWGQLEFKTAVVEALKDGTARVIVILYEDVGPIDDLDIELRTYLKMNTYVKWGSPWFWQQLRYAMPHPPKDGDGIRCAFWGFPRLRLDSSEHEILRHVQVINGDVHYISEMSENLKNTNLSSFTNSTPLIIEDENSKPIQLIPKYNENITTTVNI